MHINTHVAVGIIFSLLYSYFINPIFIQVISIFFFSFMIDFDFIFSKYAVNRNHRVLPTHGIILYLIIFFFGFLHQVFFFLGLAGISHIFIDSIDWGVGILSPFSKKIYFGHLPKPPKEVIDENELRNKQCWFTLTYYNSKLLIIIDIIITVSAVITIIFIDMSYLWYILIYVFFLVIHLYSFYKCKKQKDKKDELK
ncbi:MAG: hypothetical protein EU548_02050 [Promethearchaeota archaeon]|nr:MAG: hypothetical protein EU548_02050 [Candidatus Lokiarchaeota archaeon]